MSKFTSDQQQHNSFMSLPTVSQSLLRKTFRHGRLETVIPNGVFAIQGRFYVGAAPAVIRGLVYIGRTMTIIKDEDGSLILINGFNLTESGWCEVNKLGKVKALVRLGSYHGGDDALILNRFIECKYYLIKGMNKPIDFESLNNDIIYMTNKEDFELTTKEKQEANNMAPIAFDDINNETNYQHTMPGDLKCELLSFPEIQSPEGIMYFPNINNNGLIVSCDGLQNQSKGFLQWKKHQSVLINMVTYSGGFQGCGRCGPGLIKLNYTAWNKNGEAIIAKFFDEKVLNKKWDCFISAHGDPITKNAKDLVKETIIQQFEKHNFVNV